MVSSALPERLGRSLGGAQLPVTLTGALFARLLDAEDRTELAGGTASFVSKSADVEAFQGIFTWCSKLFQAFELTFLRLSSF